MAEPAPRSMMGWKRELRGDRIDRDQLDERARTLLNLVGKDEIVIPYEPGRRLY